jgi:ATP-dependent Clp protease adaptor protein ClpS
MNPEIQTEEKTKVAVQPPKLWRVVFHNDDATPMEFVIYLLVNVFRHEETTAKDLTLEIHNTGSAIVGVYTHEIAEQKGIEATQISRSNGHPLEITIEQE